MVSRLRVFSDPETIEFQTDEHAKISARLAQVGILFEQWYTDINLDSGVEAELVLKVYAKEIERLKKQGGYVTVDVVSLNDQDPQKAVYRQKFLQEHTHNEDEVRFFVDGSGLFNLHIENKIYEILCERGDLIALPAHTKHWFDMGAHPHFVAIRFFNNPEGWVGHFTNSQIADRYPRYE